MNSLPKPIHPDPTPLLVANAGVAHAPALQRDPIDAWIELMEVVEALCPRWPPRCSRVEPMVFRL